MLCEIIWFLKYRVGRIVCNPWTRWQTAPGAPRATALLGTEEPSPRSSTTVCGAGESQTWGWTCSQRQIPHPTAQSPAPLQAVAFWDTFWERSYLLGRKRSGNRTHFTVIHFTGVHLREIHLTARFAETDQWKLWWTWPYPNKNVRDTLSKKPLTSSQFPVIERKTVTQINNPTKQQRPVSFFPNS